MSPWQWSDTDPNTTHHKFSPDYDLLGEVSETFFGNADDMTPMSAFLSFFSDSFLEEIVVETNRYGNDLLCDENRENTYQEHIWIGNPLTVVELKLYFGLCIVMGLNKKPAISDYWSKKIIYNNPLFSKIMTRHRFVAISRYLHFVNNNTISTTDRLRKIRSVVDHLNTAFWNAYKVQEEISIDESLMKFKGRLSWKQYNPQKRARFGVKYYKMCEARSGYVKKFKIYTGRDQSDSRASGDVLPVSTSVVLDLVDKLNCPGHTIYVDNWYTSPQLFYILHSRSYNAVGTVRVNRKHMPTLFKEQKLKTGEYSRQSSGTFVALKWKDKKDVHLLSTHHKGEMKAVQTKNGTKIRPDIAVDYNFSMGGVDRHDQALSIFPVMRKYTKSYKKNFFYMMDMSLYNAYICWKKRKNQNISFRNFCGIVATSLLEYKVTEESCLNMRPRSSDVLTRLMGKHYLERIADKSDDHLKQKRCKVCYDRGKKTTKSIYQCKTCKVGLHIECFEDFHEKKNYA